MCLTPEKMPCRVPYNVPCAGCPAAWPDSTARRNCCGGSGCECRASLIVSAGGVPAQKRVQGVPVCWGMGFRCAADRLRPVLPCLICRRAWAQLPARTVCRCLRAFLGVLCAVCVRSCWALCRRARILYSSSRRGRVVGAPDRGHRKTKSLSGVGCRADFRAAWGVRRRAGGSCCVHDLGRGRCVLRVSVDPAGAVWVCAWLHQLPAWAAAAFRQQPTA